MVWDRLSNVAHYAFEAATGRFHLRAANKVGLLSRTVARPELVNRGKMEIGERVLFISRFGPVQLSTGPQGTLRIGNRVSINFGTAISAQRSVEIGNGVGIGPNSIIADTWSIVGADDGIAEDEPQPVVIEDDVWLATRVTVLPGSRIGKGSVITAGSVVSGEIPPGVVAGGAPARVLRKLGNGTAEKPALPEAPAARTPPAGAGEEKPVSPLLRRRILLAADTTLDLMEAQFEDPRSNLQLEARVAPFGQVAQALLGDPGGADYALVWTRPELAAPAYGRLVAGEDVAIETLLAEVDGFCELVLKGASSFRGIFVASWTAPPWQRGLGLVDLRPHGLAHALARMNARAMERLGSASNVFLLDSRRWIEAAPRGAYTTVPWYAAKSLFHHDVTAEAARDVRAAIDAVEGRARKLVVLDLDDTLWGGIVGDVGWQSLRLGGHDAVGEALVDFQRALKALTRRGILLALCSKNTEAVALEAIRSHPEMVLRENDFAARRINWNDKARNVAEIAQELNLGLQSIVFIDDNPVERARVREALPEVLVPDWPTDPANYSSALSKLRCFDQASFTAEDASRTRLYAEEKQRETLKAEVGSLEGWLRSLELRVRAARLSPENLTRTAQLLNKTNQLNLSTRRLTEAELVEWERAGRREVWTISVSDRFGDAGLTGIASVEVDGGVARIVDYVLSCRVMGRKVEEALVHLAVTRARALGAADVQARLLPTAKNLPCVEFWKRSGFSEAEPNLFRWRDTEYPLPEVIALEGLA
jgi:FkbH-like protein